MTLHCLKNWYGRLGLEGEISQVLNHLHLSAYWSRPVCVVCRVMDIDRSCERVGTSFPCIAAPKKNSWTNWLARHRCRRMRYNFLTEVYVVWILTSVSQSVRISSRIEAV